MDIVIIFWCIASFLGGVFISRWVFAIPKFLAYQKAQTRLLGLLVKELTKNPDNKAENILRQANAII